MMKSISSSLLLGVREEYSTQHALLHLVEELKACLDEILIAARYNDDGLIKSICLLCPPFF